MYQPQVVKRAVYWYKTDVRKQRLVKRVGREFGLKTFVETGTYKRDRTTTTKVFGRRLWSCERAGLRSILIGFGRTGGDVIWIYKKRDHA